LRPPKSVSLGWITWMMISQGAAVLPIKFILQPEAIRTGCRGSLATPKLTCGEGTSYLYHNTYQFDWDHLALESSGPVKQLVDTSLFFEIFQSSPICGWVTAVLSVISVKWGLIKMIIELNGKRPTIGEGVYVAPNAVKDYMDFSRLYSRGSIIIS
jgi:hypothetical protein